MNQANLDNTIFIIHGSKFDSKEYKKEINSTNINFLCIDSPEELKPYSNYLFIFDAQLLENVSFNEWKKHFSDCISISEQYLELNSDLILPIGFPKNETLKLLNFACRQLLLQRKDKLQAELSKAENQRITQLNNISIALSKENNLGILLRKILQESQNLSDCDAVSLYLLDNESKELVFKLAYNDTLDLKIEEFRMPLSQKSISGYAAISNSVVVIDDAYQIPASAPYQFNSALDEEHNYRSQSILAVPISNHRNEVIGVLQFINRKINRDIKLTTAEITNKSVIPFSSGLSHLLQALASQAAISIDNAILIENINNLFEGFVQASVTAIEQRDPTTSGHSFRVADLTTTLAKRIVTSENHDYRQLNFSADKIREIRYASLLHDFGKVGVRENVLIKSKKLPENRLDLLHYRFELEKERLKRKALEQELHLHHSHSPVEDIHLIHKKLQQEINLLDKYYQAIMEANEPSILPDGNFKHLQNLKDRPYTELDGQAGFLISESDFLSLSVKRGSLTNYEREEIQSHVVHTLNFLNQIPWTSDLSEIPTIAAAHHEKLNGNGYPYSLCAEQISIPSRMMAICDIYDALVAKDRPYKHALNIEKALAIIESEVNQGLLDEEIFKVFISEKIYQVTTHKDYKPSMNTAEPMKQGHICDINLHTK
ncbi:MAG: GAF domain-containing protein [gamma proteobacterium symbiont of Taylorina sp.]|nr:GAF domain-containing protein [gamma proteobacterium symbiont of Taylorina sp.]